LTKEAGIGTVASFILGLPGETHETLKETLNFILKTMPPELRLNLLILYPGTTLWEKRKEFGIRILEPPKLKFYTHAIPTTETKDLSWRELLRTRSLIMREYHKAIGEPLVELGTNLLTSSEKELLRSLNSQEKTST